MVRSAISEVAISTAAGVAGAVVTLGSIAPAGTQIVCCPIKSEVSAAVPVVAGRVIVTSAVDCAPESRTRFVPLSVSSARSR
jgi:hypothetical protein